MNTGFRPVAFAAAVVLAAAHVASAQPQHLPNRARLPLSFEPNVGQAAPDVAFAARGPRYTASLTSSGPRLTLDSATLAVEFVGGDPAAPLVAHESLPGTANYFLGSNPARWRTGVPTYRAVRAAHVYEGIDVIYYGEDGLLEYDIVVAPGASPSAIRLAFRNAERVSVAANGDLVLTVNGRELRQRRPVIYQHGRDGRRKQIAGAYVAGPAGIVRFSIGRYDRRLPLVIDPVLVYSTHMTSLGAGAPLAVDTAGSAYAAAIVVPLTGFQSDAAVIKIDPTGSFIVYTAYLGGSQSDVPIAIAVDPRGAAYVVGATASPDFPTFRAFQPSYGGGVLISNNDGFVARFSPQGNALEYSTYLGGSHGDEINAIAVTPVGEAIVAGRTDSSNFPVANPLQPLLRGPMDMFVARFTPSGAALTYSTFLGGSASDAAFGIALDAAGNAYVSGNTDSIDFPVVNAFQPVRGGEFDGAVAKLAADGSAVRYATYLGGTAGDFMEAIAVTPDGRAIVCGATISADFPTVNATQPDLSGFADAFVTLFEPGGSTVSYSTFLGGSSTESCYEAAIDAQGRAHVTGATDSADFPLQDALQPNPGGSGDAFVTTIVSGGTIEQSTYLGGSAFDHGVGIALDNAGAIYVAGSTQSADFPVTPAAVQRTLTDGSDGFVSKVGAICGPEVTGDLDIGPILNVKIPLTPWRLQLVLVRNHGADAIGGPLTLVVTNLQNAAFAGSPYTTSCIDGVTSPFTIVTGGSDGVLSPGEISGQWLLFYEPGVPVSYLPRVLSGVPGR